MAEAHSLPSRVSVAPDPWKSQAYAGYSMICKTPGDRKRVLTALSQKKDVRATTMPWTTFTGFVFVQPKKSMTVYAFDSWRYRHHLRDLDLILHTSAGTVTEGLLTCLRPQIGNQGYSCKYFLPQSIEGASAEDGISVGSQPSVLSKSVDKVSTGVSTPGVGCATTDHHRPWFPPSIHRTHFVESLTPLLFGPDDLLVSRSRGYKIGEYLGGGSFGAVHKAKSPTGEDVAVKILHKDAWGEMPDRQRTMKEVYVLERCSDLNVHLVRVLDVFLDKKTPNDAHRNGAMGRIA